MISEKEEPLRSKTNIPNAIPPQGICKFLSYKYVE